MKFGARCYVFSTFIFVSYSFLSHLFYPGGGGHFTIGSYGMWAPRNSVMTKSQDFRGILRPNPRIWMQFLISIPLKNKWKIFDHSKPGHPQISSTKLTPIPEYLFEKYIPFPELFVAKNYPKLVHITVRSESEVPPLPWHFVHNFFHLLWCFSNKQYFRHIRLNF